MLMRNSTRIEFRLEDAQEYIKAREAQAKRPQGGAGRQAAGGQTCTLPPVMGASPATDAAPTPQSSAAMSPIDRAASEGEEAPTESLTFAPQREAETERFQSEVEQLAVLGIDEEDARRALRATGGDLEAAADRLLL
eukprot:Skav218530  [mRNA]  locus=scaffold2478:328151:328561:- [translate_table: standard]